MANQYTSPWTEEMDEILMDNGGAKSLKWLADQVGKTERAVERRMERLGIRDKHALTGTFTAYQLGNILGIDSKIVVDWIKKKGLPANQGEYYREKGKLKPQRYKRYFINVDKFWKWAEKNRSCLNWSRVSKNCLPPEPKWVEEQRTIDYKKGKNIRIPWTPKQDQYLWDYYYKDGKSQKEIAEILGRTTNGVEKRLKRLREQKLVRN
jgi:hypothetical protein